jgi:hypothetical protein
MRGPGRRDQGTNVESERRRIPMTADLFLSWFAHSLLTSIRFTIVAFYLEMPSSGELAVA